MRKHDKKMHRKFHCDRKNVSWLKSGNPISGYGPRGKGGEYFEFIENSNKG